MINAVWILSDTIQQKEEMKHVIKCLDTCCRGNEYNVYIYCVDVGKLYRLKSQYNLTLFGVCELSIRYGYQNICYSLDELKVISKCLRRVPAESRRKEALNEERTRKQAHKNKVGYKNLT